jgi:hypothetical protein
VDLVRKATADLVRKAVPEVTVLAEEATVAKADVPVSAEAAGLLTAPSILNWRN